MLRVLLWVVSNDYRFLNGAINILDRQHKGIEVVDTVKGIDFSKVDEGDYEILVIGAKQIGMNRITQAACQLRLPEEKLLGDWIVTIPGFTLNKYRQLQRSRLSIFSRNCFGGLISNTLGLRFLSPFVNMFFREQEYIRFLHELRIYMEEDLQLKETAWEKNLKFDYPIFKLGNVDIHMNHYRDFDEAVKIWERRKARINWYNLFVTAYTDNEEFLREFDSLPYGKKVCFVPFKSDLDSAWYINRELTRKEYFWRTVNDFGSGNPFYYDPFDMLLYGKKTPLIDM